MPVTIKPTQRPWKCVSSILSLRVTWKKVSRHLAREVPRQVRQSMRRGKTALKSECKPKSQSERHNERGQFQLLAADDKIHATQYVLGLLNTGCSRQYGERGPKYRKQGELAVYSTTAQRKIMFPGSFYVRDVHHSTLFQNSP